MLVKTSISLVIGDDPELVLTADEARQVYDALRGIFEPSQMPADSYNGSAGGFNMYDSIRESELRKCASLARV